jgi:CheY-like chemotaxis protein
MDDEAMVRNALMIVLKRLGYEVDSAQDGAEALEKYQQATSIQKPFDVVIMDLTIRGGMGGKEAIEKLLRIDPKARAIVSSGYSDDPVMANYQEFGFAGVVGKPYRVQELKQVLDEVKGLAVD